MPTYNLQDAVKTMQVKTSANFEITDNHSRILFDGLQRLKERLNVKSVDATVNPQNSKLYTITIVLADNRTWSQTMQILAADDISWSFSVPHYWHTNETASIRDFRDGVLTTFLVQNRPEKLKVDWK